MKSQLIQTAGNLGGYQVARWLTARQPKILMYHRFTQQPANHSVCAATFEQQLKLIKKHFQPMTLTALAEAIEREGQAPKHAVVITVDDGYRDFYEVAYPLLKHYGVPATFFVTTGFVNQDLWLWPDQVSWLLDNRQHPSGELRVGAHTIPLDLPTSDVWRQLINTFLNVPNELRVQGLQDLAAICQLELPEKAPEQYAASNWQQLAEMQQAGIEIGGHTVSHPSLGHMTEQQAAWEINHSLAMLTEHLGPVRRSFCFPNGQPGDYSEQVRAQVQQAGYSACVTAFSDQYNLRLPFAWRRFVGCEERFQFNKSLFGVEHLGNRLRGTARCHY